MEADGTHRLPNRSSNHFRLAVVLYGVPFWSGVMSKETNDAWVNAHYGHDAHPIADNKSAAAQPVAEIAWSDDGYKIGLLGPLRAHRLPIGTKLYAAPVAAAPVGVSRDDAEQAISRIMGEYGFSMPSRAYAELVDELMSTPAAPWIDLEQFRPFVESERARLGGAIERAEWQISCVASSDGHNATLTEHVAAMRSKLEECDRLLAMIASPKGE